jgi:hypothetical protein
MRIVGPEDIEHCEQQRRQNGTDPALLKDRKLLTSATFEANARISG